MKKRLILFALLSLFIMTSLVSAACDLDVELVNQDPYPAVPGEYVEIVFQVTGVDDVSCGEVAFELLETYPLVFDPEFNPRTTIQSGTHTHSFESFLLVPYRVRVDRDALNGDNPIEVRLSYTGPGVVKTYETKEVNLNVEEVRTDFEVTIKDYNPTTKELIFEILNIGESDIDALTIEIPKQEDIVIKGSNRNIVGDLDSNEDTTFSFEATPEDGMIKIKILYTDKTNVRRSIEKYVKYDSDYFTGRAGDSNGHNYFGYLIVILIIAGVVWWWWRRKKKRKEQRRG